MRIISKLQNVSNSKPLRYIHLIITLDTDNQTVIGYCLYQSLFEQAEILRIGTHPDFHRQGIAQQLLTYLFQHLTNTDSILLEVRADNIPAINLYQKLNFISIDCRKGYYTLVDQSAVDGLIMQKLL